MQCLLSMHLFTQHTFKLFAALGLASLAACEAEIPGESGGSNPNAGLQQEFNDNVLPLLNSTCASCHGAERSTAEFEFVGIMDPAANKTQTIFDAVLEWPGFVNKTDPDSSRLITKGAHQGRAWREDELKTINAWLVNVGIFYGGGGNGDDIETSIVTPAGGANQFDLGDLGVEGGAGNTLHFKYTFDSQLVILDSFEIEAGPNGVTLDTPYVGIIADGVTYWDPNNKFQGVVADVAPNDRQCIGPCSVIGSWVPATALAAGPPQLIFGFKEFIPSGTGNGGGGGSGCKDVDFFWANTAGAFGACTSCHSPAGNNTQWLRNINAPANDMDARAQQCNDILIRTNHQNTANPHLLLQTPTAGTHPNVDITGIEAALDAFVANEAAQ